MKQTIRFLCLTLLAIVTGMAQAQNVAKIGDTEYATLQAAIDAIPVNGTEVTLALLQDVTVNSGITIPEGSNVKLDFAGNKIVLASNWLFENKGSLTLNDSESGGGISFTNNTLGASGGKGCVDNYGTLTVNAGNYETFNTGSGSALYNNPGATMTINGGTVNAGFYAIVNDDGNLTINGGTMVSSSCSKCDPSFAYCVSSNGTFKMTNGTIKGVHGALAITGGTSTISDGIVSALTCTRGNHGTSGTHYALYVAGENVIVSCTVNGGSFSSTGAATVMVGNSGDGGNKENAALVINDGTFTHESGGTVVKVDNILGNPYICGGTFSGDISSITSDYLADGCTFVDNGNGTYSVAKPSYVAQIGETKYVSLQAAVDAAYEMSGDVTITLIDDIEGYSIVKQKAGLNLTIDGAGKTVAGQIIIDGDGGSTRTETLDIKNIKFEGNTSNFCSGTDAFILVPSTNTAGTPYYNKPTNNYAHNVTISDCSFTSTSTGLNVVAIKTSSGGGNCYNLVVKDVTGTNLHSLAQLTGSEGANSITNCTVTSSESFVNVSGGTGTFTVSGNTFTSAEGADGYGIRENSGSSAVITLTDNTFTAASAVKLGKSGSATNGTINVVSGTYVGDIVKDIAASATGKIVISGGQFSADLTDTTYEPFIAEGKIGVQNNAVEAAPYSVEDGTYVAQVILGESTHKYGSLESAFAAAADGSTVKLLDDCAGNGIVVPQGKYTTGLTVDFDNHTYTVDGETVGSTGTETNGFQLLKDNTITFKNGTITSTKAKILVQNYSNLTLEGMTLTLNNENYNEAYTLSNNNGNVVIDGTTINANPAGGFAFDVCRYSSYESVSVTVTGDSEINGNVEVYASGSDAKNGFNLMLESGNITGDIVIDATAGAAMATTPDKAIIKEKDSFNQAAPTGYMWVSDGEGTETSTLAPRPYVAQIGDVKYWSLADAVAAVSADGTETTITMIDDETIEGNAGVTIPADKNVVLDLNGKTIKGIVQSPANAYTILNQGTLVITDNSDEKNGTITNEVSDENAGSPMDKNWASNVISNNGTLTVNNGNIINTGTGGACYAIDNQTNGNLFTVTLNINGGYINAAKVAIRMFCNSTTNDNIVNMTGGVVSGGVRGIQTQIANKNANKATLNISGGYINGGSYAWLDTGYNNTVTNQYDNVSYTITGGFFIGDMWSYATYYHFIDGFVSGGYFDRTVGGDLVTPGSACVENTDEATKEAYPYTVGLADVHYYWLDNNGNIDGGGYYTIYAPFAGPDPVLMDGEFVELQRDVTLTQDIEYLEECSFGNPIFKGGTFTLTFGEYNIDLNGFHFPIPVGVTILTDKQTDIFSAADANYKVVESTTETGYAYTIVQKEYVAQIGDVLYETLAEAVAAVPADGTETTITMIADETINNNAGVTIAATQNVVLDLNGFTVSQYAPDAKVSHLIENKGTLTIKDSSDTNADGTGTGKLYSEASQPSSNYGYATNLISNRGQLTIESGYLESHSRYASYVVDNYDNGNAVINGGHLYNYFTSAIRQFCNSTTAENDVIVNGGIVEGYCTMWIQSANSNANKGSLTINGGTFKTTEKAVVNGEKTIAEGDSYLYMYPSNANMSLTITGGEFDTNIATWGEGTIEISGGTFNGWIYSDTQEGFITGGYFIDEEAAKLDEAYVAEGYICVPAADKPGYYIVKQGSFICAIGTTKYETLADAVAAAGTAETTITLLTEAATDGVISGAGVVVPSGSNITFDLNGLTYDVSGTTIGSTNTETLGFQLLKNSNITFKNGTLKATSPTAQMLIQNYSNLTLEDVNLDGTELSGAAYALSNNSGTVNLTGSTSITAKTGGRAFDTYKFGSYAIPTVNINTTGAITGPIEATGGKLNIENGLFDVTWVTDNNYTAGDIQITGGVFSEGPDEEYLAEGYIVTENTDEATMSEYPYTVKSKEDAGIFELVHGEPYPYPEGRDATSVTYKRTFSTSDVGKYRSWFVPFDYTITNEDGENFDFYKIHMIAASDMPGIVDNVETINIYLQKVGEGTVLRANRPYVVKAKNELTDHIFTAENITKIYAEDHTSRLHEETTQFNYDFYGTYREFKATKAYDWLALSKNSISWNASSAAKLKSYVWYIKVTPREENDDYAKIIISFIEEDVANDISNDIESEYEIEGIYNVNGTKVDNPVKGINIIRFNNGKTKKVIIK